MPRFELGLWETRKMAANTVMFYVNYFPVTLK